jgi:hypothetical protein
MDFRDPGAGPLDRPGVPEARTDARSDTARLYLAAATSVVLAGGAIIAGTCAAQ